MCLLEKRTLFLKCQAKFPSCLIGQISVTCLRHLLTKETTMIGLDISKSTPRTDDGVSLSLQSTGLWGRGRIPEQTWDAEGRMQGFGGVPWINNQQYLQKCTFLTPRRKNIRMFTSVSGFYFLLFAYFYLNVCSRTCNKKHKMIKFLPKYLIDETEFGWRQNYHRRKVN